MKTVNNVSGGKTSAYVAAHYPADYNVFALVRVEDQNCRFPDEKLRREVEDRIQKPFIGTVEDDTIIYTMLDLEQYLGRPITWVSGLTFEGVLAIGGGILPNALRRFCTTFLKVAPTFEWWLDTIGEPFEARFGYRANELNRVQKMLNKLNENGLLEFEYSFEKHVGGRHDGLNKWENVEWQRPAFPLVQDNIYKDTINTYWEYKPVRFAKLNNCAGCFHRNPLLLRKMYEVQPNKVQWFADQEKKKVKEGYGSTWRMDTSYQKIIDHPLQFELGFDDFSECDSGYCEL